MFGISIPGMSDATEASPLVDGESSSSSMMPSLFGSTATTPPEGGEASADGSEDHVGLEIGEGQQEVMAIALRARNLIMMDAAYVKGKPSANPFMQLKIGNDKDGWGPVKKTSSRSYTRKPEWKEEKFFKIPSDTSSPLMLRAEVYNYHDISEPNFMGSVDIPLRDLNGGHIRKWFKLGGTVHSPVLGEKQATGQVELFLQIVTDEKPPKPLPPAVTKIVYAVVPVLAYVVGLLMSLYFSFMAALMDGVAYYSLWLGIYLATGFTVKLRRVNLRLGFATDSATEIVVSGLEVPNPVGGYLSENFIELDRLEIHIKISSIIAAIRRKYAPWWTFPKRGQQAKWWSFPHIEVPYIAVRGLRVVTEKAYGSPYSDRAEQMLNVWGFLGGTPDAMKPKTAEEIAEIHKQQNEAREQKKIDEAKAKEEAKAERKAAKKAAKAAKKKAAAEGGEEAKGDDVADDDEAEAGEGEAKEEEEEAEREPPNRLKYEEQLAKSKGCPFKLKCNAILIQDMDLFVADLLSELIGGPPLRDSRPAHVNFILDKTDMGHDGVAKAFMLQKLINLAWRKAELMSIVNDLAMQVAQAAENRINPLAIIGVINSLTGGMIYDAEDD